MSADALYARALRVLSGMAPTRAEFANVLGLDVKVADGLLGRLATQQHAWPQNRGGTFVWELTAAGKVALEAEHG